MGRRPICRSRSVHRGWTLQILVLGGQNFSALLGSAAKGAKEYDSASAATAEIVRLWLAIEAMRGARDGGALE
jgi:hypothetical protein